MVDATTRLYARLRGLYEAVAVVPTPSTSVELLARLQDAAVDPLEASRGAVGTGRRHALRLGLSTGASHLHYCDFDRLLHWLDRYPGELDRVLADIPRWDYLVLGRSDRAFATHPRVQRDTEIITNHAFSLWFGRPVDVTAGSCAVSRRAAELLLAGSTAPTNATDTEWPALVLRKRYEVGYLATEGLEFETADYFPKEIAAAGSLEAWLEERSRPLAAWIGRTRLTLESLEALERIVGSE